MGQRRYKIEAVIGQGGFGRVYRAILEADGGFRKRVAIKVISVGTEAQLPNLMERFRDEARILGLIQDRAFVSVEPPVMLNGRWAVVMDYAEGESAKALLRHGGFPPACAIEIVQEMARALSTAYWKPGQDGEPLRLLHRDLKPANLQISASGEIRLLDFGIAKARFDEREALTTNDWAGTAGYAAPERLEGEDGPEGDVYSLGIVLQVLVTRDTPLGAGQFKEKNARSPQLDSVLELARKMYDLDPRARPRMRNVEQLCRELLRKLPGPTLREWAESKVEVGRGEKQDENCGDVWFEGDSPDGEIRVLPKLEHDGGGHSTTGTLETGSSITGTTPSSGRMLPYTMGKLKLDDAKPLRERQNDGNTPIPEYADATEIQKRSEARAEAQRRETERKAAEEAERIRQALLRPPPTPRERFVAFIKTPRGVAALVGTALLAVLIAVTVFGAFSVTLAADTAQAATEGYFDEVEASGRDLGKSLVSMGLDPAAFSQHYDPVKRTADPAERVKACDAFVTWALEETPRRVAAAGNSLQTSTATAKAQRLQDAQRRVHDAGMAWSRVSSTVPGMLAVTLHLARAPQPR